MLCLCQVKGQTSQSGTLVYGRKDCPVSDACLMRILATELIVKLKAFCLPDLVKCLFFQSYF